MKLPDKTYRVTLGFIITSLLTLIVCFFFSVHEETVAAFLLFSVLCTAGLSLFVYFFLFYAIGAAADTIYRGISKSKNEQIILGLKSPKNLTYVQKAALNYITKARNQGYSDNRIIALMTSKGWSEDTIHSFFPGA